MPSTSRYIPLPSKAPSHVKEWEAVNKDLVSALLRDVRQVQKAGDDARPSRHDSIYTGLSGIAFMEYCLCRMDLPVQDRHMTPNLLTALADRRLSDILRKNPINTESMYSPSRLSFLESSIGIATLVLSRASRTTDQVIINNWKASKEYLIYAIHRTLASDDEDYTPADKEDGCEVLYGRAGLVYSLLYLRKACKSGEISQEMAPLGELLSDDILIRLVDSIMMRGRHGAHALSSEFRLSDEPCLPALMWTWHGRRYLGGAHGVAGILQVLLLCPITVIQKHLLDIFKTISWLVDCQDETGNWPSRCPNQRGISAENDLIQWCHGAPGILVLLSTAIRVLQDPRSVVPMTSIEDKCRRSLHSGANLVYKCGLLRKGVGLCHGGAGSVYALLAASDALDTATSTKFFVKAAHLAFLATFHSDMMTSEDMKIPDHPWSMYEGLAGTCCAWAEILCRLDSKDPRRRMSGFPGYDDIAWD